MTNDSFYDQILLDHNMHPLHKREMEEANIENEGVNPSCGDDITLHLVLSDNVIKDGSFTGDGCAISQASADIMLSMIIGKTVEEALSITSSFFKMIKGEASEEEIENLEEAGALRDISHMPARVKCAVLAWHTLRQMLKKD